MPKVRIEGGKFVVEGKEKDVAGLDGLEIKKLKVRRSDQMRWRDGSFLTKQQRVDEDWGRRDDIEQQRVQSL